MKNSLGFISFPVLVVVLFDDPLPDGTPIGAPPIGGIGADGVGVEFEFDDPQKNNPPDNAVAGNTNVLLNIVMVIDSVVKEIREIKNMENKDVEIR